MTTRTLILNVLRAEARPMTLAEIGKRIGISPQLARVHVKSLVQAGLAESAGVVPAINGRTAQTFRSTTTVKESLQVDRPREHISSPDCWCEPELDYKDPDTGAEVWVHRGLQ